MTGHLTLLPDYELFT